MMVLWILGLALLSQPVTEDQPVSVEQLSETLGLPLMPLKAANHRSQKASAGSFFLYSPPIEGKSTFGILQPRQDQSYFRPRQAEGFWPQITNGMVAPDVASSVIDKVQQLKRQEIYGGPRVHGLGILENFEDDFDLVLPVDHMDGIRIPRAPEERSFETQKAFFDLFLHMISDGYIPLDYRYPNVLIDPQTHETKPVDIMLTTPEELDQQIASGTKLGTQRVLQLAETVVEIDRSSSDLTPSGYICRSIIRDLRTRFPGEGKWEPGIWKKVSTPLPAAGP